jgi:hypothetical protein
LPPGQPAYGLTQAQWLEAYVQWYGSIPVSSSPWFSYDSDGTHAGVGQHGPVWFLSSQNRGTQFSRTVTVPEGKAILAVATGFTAAAVPGAKTDASLLNQAAADTSVALGQVTRFEVSLDGAPVEDLLPYRVHTDVFNVDLPPDNFSNSL